MHDFYNSVECCRHVAAEVVGSNGLEHPNERKYQRNKQTDKQSNKQNSEKLKNLSSFGLSTRLNLLIEETFPQATSIALVTPT